MLVGIVKNMRNYIENAGGEFCFSSKMTDIQIENGKVCAIIINDTQKIENRLLGSGYRTQCQRYLFSIKSKNLPMEAKAFAGGLRAEHPQTLINLYQYGQENSPYMWSCFL